MNEPDKKSGDRLPCPYVNFNELLELDLVFLSRHDAKPDANGDIVHMHEASVVSVARISLRSSGLHFSAVFDLSHIQHLFLRKLRPFLDEFKARLGFVAHQALDRFGSGLAVVILNLDPQQRSLARVHGGLF